MSQTEITIAKDDDGTFHYRFQLGKTYYADADFASEESALAYAKSAAREAIREEENKNTIQP